MSSATLYRLSGIALLLGGVLAAMGTVLQALNDQPLSVGWIPAVLLVLVGGMIGVFGLPALYVKQANTIKVWGLAGFLLLMLSGQILGIGDPIIDLVILPTLATKAPALLYGSPIPALVIFLLTGVFLFTIGAILLGILTLRARIFPRWPGVLLIASAVIAFLGGFLKIPFTESVAVVILQIALIWFGTALISQPSKSVVHSRVES